MPASAAAGGRSDRPLKGSLLDLLACPLCHAGLALSAGRREGDEVLEGTLTCAGCALGYPVSGGVPRLNVAMEGTAQVARSFGYEWAAYSGAALAAGKVFGRSALEEWADFVIFTGLEAASLRGATVLDAGCGTARLTAAIGDAGAAAVIGMDVSDAVDAAFQRCRALANVHIVQANMLAPPLATGVFDVVWSMGAVHHTPDARVAHAALARLVSPGGVLFVWVYSRRLNPFRLGKALLAALQLDRLPAPALRRLAWLLAAVSAGSLRAYAAARRVPPLRPRTAWGRRALKPRTRAELELTWFDALAPEHASRHTAAEVAAWFGDRGFEDVYVFDDPNVAVRGRAPSARRLPTR